MYDDYPTEAEYHMDWHLTTGEKYGCPWDVCHAPEALDDTEALWPVPAEAVTPEPVLAPGDLPF